MARPDEAALAWKSIRQILPAPPGMLLASRARRRISRFWWMPDGPAHLALVPGTPGRAPGIGLERVLESRFTRRRDQQALGLLPDPGLSAASEQRGAHVRQSTSPRRACIPRIQRRGSQRMALGAPLETARRHERVHVLRPGRRLGETVRTRFGLAAGSLLRTRGRFSELVHLGLEVHGHDRAVAPHLHAADLRDPAALPVQAGRDESPTPRRSSRISQTSTASKRLWPTM